MSIEVQKIREALGCFATGIAIVTILDRQGEPAGMTINSFNSVSLEPPLVLFSVAKMASLVEDFLVANSYAINILRDDQESYSEAFAKPGENGFNRHRPISGNGPAPLLEGTLAVFEGSRYAIHEGGDHHIFVVEIENLSRFEYGDPLLYYRGRYSTVR